MTTYTRRDKWQLTPEILSQWRTLAQDNNLSGFKEFLAKYNPHVSEDEKAELIEDFKQLAEKARQFAARDLRRRWRGPK